MVEAVRAATIFAHDAKQYDRWKASTLMRHGAVDTGKGLAELLSDVGGAVERGGFEFRN